MILCVFHVKTKACETLPIKVNVIVQFVLDEFSSNLVEKNSYRVPDIKFNKKSMGHLVHLITMVTRISGFSTFKFLLP